MIPMHIYFKLFNNIKSPHEANELARLEILGLFGEVEPVGNLINEFLDQPLRSFADASFPNRNDGVRVVDCFTHELPYGRIQAYKGKLPRIQSISRLIRRLGYTREIFVLQESNEPEIDVRQLFPESVIGMNAQYVVREGLTLYRFITHQYFLEKSEYISKLSRNEEEIDANVGRLFEYLADKLYRIPATATMRVGRRLEDYFAIREEPSLYLTHYMHPYKGKFHPKMVRALLNYVCPGDEGTVMDNFAGSGTLLVEAVMMGLNAIGVEINPLSVLMSNVKCHSLTKLDPARLAGFVEGFLKDYAESVAATRKKQATLDSALKSAYLKDERRVVSHEISAISRELREWDKALFGLDEDTLADILICKRIMSRINDPYIREFMLLVLSGSISDVTRRRSAEFIEVLKERVHDLYLRVYLFRQLNKILKISVGEGQCYEADTRDISSLKIHDIDGNVNSPPYSTALDYIRNDQPQLTILGLHPNLAKLVQDMIGFPGKNYDPEKLQSEILQKKEEFMQLSDYARDVALRLLEGGRRDQALRSYKFFRDTYLTLGQIWKVLRSGAKYAIIIGNNHFKIGGPNNEGNLAEEDGNGLSSDLEFDSSEHLLPAAQSGYVEVRNDQVTLELGLKIGFQLDRKITRVLEKTSAGNIRYESVVILKKQ
jgi:hypothetical protein